MNRGSRTWMLLGAGCLVLDRALQRIGQTVSLRRPQLHHTNRQLQQDCRRFDHTIHDIRSRLHNHPHGVVSVRDSFGEVGERVGFTDVGCH